MKYPELGLLDSTPDQDLGLTIAWKTAVNSKELAIEDVPTPGAYLARTMRHALESYGASKVKDEQKARISTAFDSATDQARAAAAQALGVDITIVVPADVVKL